MAKKTKTIPLEDYYELLQEARDQVDKKYPRGRIQTNMLYDMLLNEPKKFNAWAEAHHLLFWCRDELKDE